MGYNSDVNSCLSESRVLHLVQEGLASDPEARAHLDSCDQCQALLAETARTTGPTSSVETPRWSGEGPSALAAVLAPQVGRYRLSRALGAGAMGEVWAAHDPQLDREVAVKILRVEASDAPDVAERLLREARALARLDHPNVVRVYDAGEEGGRPFLVMALVEGRTLRAWLNERARPPGEILEVFQGAGRGLAAAHRAGIVHRDFKPENVFIDGAMRVVVGDFGLARQGAAPDEPAAPGAEARPPTVTRTGAFIGTPAYMAPEQLAQKPADARSDQFAFAVALWEALSGRRPFSGRTVGEKCPSPLGCACSARARRAAGRSASCAPRRCASRRSRRRERARRRCCACSGERCSPILRGGSPPSTSSSPSSCARPARSAGACGARPRSRSARRWPWLRRGRSGLRHRRRSRAARAGSRWR
jgi:serine/threonine protein kinase